MKYQGMFPTFEEEMSLAIGEKVDVIRYLIDVLIKFSAVEKKENDVYYIYLLEDNIWSETDYAMK